MGSHGEDYEVGESGVDYAMAERVIKNLHFLDRSEGEITIIMNNIGGDVYHGMAIFDAIKACENEVTIIAYGHAMSMGSVIMQAADTRIMTPNARMMLHYGYGGHNDHLKNLYKHIDELKKLDKIINQIYLEKIKEKKPRFTMKQLEEKMNFDWFLDAKESIEFGLCDKILE